MKARRFQRRRCLKLLTTTSTTTMTTAPEHGFTISLHCEHEGSGELKRPWCPLLGIFFVMDSQQLHK